MTRVNVPEIVRLSGFYLGLCASGLVTRVNVPEVVHLSW